ncbi:hypothetical protein C772_01072 [Bhargavaea cecembensis DSE10]|uniref:Uncharacterized protein n=1 Tax=Bhargavaea cecembensis DSE10 TaxID=1235279 RepID=M7NIE0_9BACL|nr:hypothetical protein C772_01072 [Bhargavaea cecembensis DSE10]
MFAHESNKFVYEKERALWVCTRTPREHLQHQLKPPPTPIRINH